jgi:hypothetical protein
MLYDTVQLAQLNRKANDAVSTKGSSRFCNPLKNFRKASQCQSNTFDAGFFLTGKAQAERGRERTLGA